ADADTLPEPEPLFEAIYSASGDRRVHLPYDEYRSLGWKGTKQLQAGAMPQHCAHVVIPFATSGVYVTTPATWWAAGGQDEEMLGGGMEDMAWLVAHRLLLGCEPARHRGRVDGTAHKSPGKDGPKHHRDVARCRRYLQAAETGDSDADRRLTTRTPAPQAT